MNTNSQQNNEATPDKRDTYLLIGMTPSMLGLPQSFVFFLFWNWFVKPLGLPGIRYWQAFGLMIFVSFIRYEERKTEDSKDNDTRWYTPLRRQYSYYLIFLLMGWIAHLLTR